MKKDDILSLIAELTIWFKYSYPKPANFIYSFWWVSIAFSSTKVALILPNQETLFGVYLFQMYLLKYIYWLRTHDFAKN